MYPSQCTEYIAPYRFEDNTKIRINKMRWDWMCLIHGRNSWKASLNMVIFLEVLYRGIPCSESCLTTYGGTGVTGIKVSEVTVLHCSRRKELRNSDI